MNRSLQFPFPSSLRLSICLVFGIVACKSVGAQPQSSQPGAPAAETQQERYYGGNMTNRENKSIAQQKAAKRAEQRMARLDAMRWYGFSASRPTAAALPFTSMYSPAWSQPGGRPFAWQVGGRTEVFLRRPYYRSYYRFR